jgi:hypothetical protein
MNTPLLENDLWRECPEGQLHQFAKQDRSRKFRKHVTQTATYAMMLCLVSVAGFLWLSRDGNTSTRGEPNYGGIVCSEVTRQASSFALNELDEATARKIEAHIKQCPLCANHIERIRTGTAFVPKTHLSSALPSPSQSGLWEEQPSRLPSVVGIALYRLSREIAQVRMVWASSKLLLPN